MPRKLSQKQVQGAFKAARIENYQRYLRARQVYLTAAGWDDLGNGQWSSPYKDGPCVPREQLAADNQEARDEELLSGRKPQKWLPSSVPTKDPPPRKRSR